MEQNATVSSRRTQPPTPGAGADAGRRLGWLVTVATLGGLLFGYDTGVTNGALAFMVDYFVLNSFQEGLITFTLLLGAALGSVLGGRAADAFGRKRVTLSVAVIFIVGATGCVVALTFDLLLLFRFVLGVAVGVSSVVVPTYLAEVAPRERRGSLVSRNEFMLVIGQFLAFGLNALIGNVWGADDHVWRYMLAVAVVPALLFLIGMLPLPESPRWLAANGRNDEAMTVLRSLRTPERAEQEMAEVADLAQVNSREPHPRLRDVVRETWLRRLLLLGIGIACFQQLTGVNSVMYYGTQVLEQAGFTRNAALGFNVLNGVMAVTAVGVAMTLINRFPRRTFLLIGYCGTTTTHLLIGAVGLFLPADSGARPWLLLVLIVVFIGIMQGCLGPTLFVLLSEIFPLRVRGLMVGTTMLCLWVTNALIALVFPALVGALGFATFWVFAAVGVVAVVFVGRSVPETRGRTLEEIEEGFRTRYERLPA